MLYLLQFQHIRSPVSNWSIKLLFIMIISGTVSGPFFSVYIFTNIFTTLLFYCSRLNMLIIISLIPDLLPDCRIHTSFSYHLSIDYHWAWNWAKRLKKRGVYFRYKRFFYIPLIRYTLCFLPWFRCFTGSVVFVPIEDPKHDCRDTYAVITSDPSIKHTSRHTSERHMQLAI
jgi:hypothetical protein